MFAAAWFVNSAIITSASLDNAARRDTSTLVAEQQSWIQEWHNVVFSDDCRFCVQYFDSFREDRTLCLHSILAQGGPEFSLTVWPDIEYTTRTFLVRIDGNLNAHRYIYDILQPIVVPYFRDRSTAIFQQDNVRSHFEHYVLTFLDIQGNRSLL